MVVLDKKAFKLPYVDSQTYRELMRLGLRYDREQKMYNAEMLSLNEIGSVLDLLSRVLHDKVSFEQAASQPAKNAPTTQTCIGCGKKFACEECRYYELCETKGVSSGCVCGKCLEEGKSTE